MNKPNNYEPPIIPDKKGMAIRYMTSYKKNSMNINKLAKTETSWKFWMLCATLLMFPLGNGVMLTWP